MTTRASSHKSVTLVKTNTVVHVPITMVNAISTLVGEEIEGEELHLVTVVGKNGYLYCIPFRACRVKTIMIKAGAMLSWGSMDASTHLLTSRMKLTLIVLSQSSGTRK